MGTFKELAITISRGFVSKPLRLDGDLLRPIRRMQSQRVSKPLRLDGDLYEILPLRSDFLFLSHYGWMGTIFPIDYLLDGFDVSKPLRLDGDPEQTCAL